jgi:hypothetical protein
MHMDRRGSTTLGLLVFVLASLATASIAHAAIGMLDASGLGGNAYGTYTHVAIVPLSCLALVFAGLIVVVAVAKRVARASHYNSVTAVLRSVKSISRGVSILAVTAGGLTSLVSMEFFEQTASLGHIASFAVALGGVPFVGVGLVALAAVLVVSLGLALLQVAVGTALRAASAFIAWVGADAGKSKQRTLVMRRIPVTRRAAIICAGQNLGSRPPPAVVQF